MADSFDKSAILDSFIAEVRSYLPRIKAGIEGFIADSTQTELLEESHRLAHTVKNSSLMMGYPNLSKVAHPIEEALLEVMEGKTSLWAETMATIYRALERAGSILNGLKSGVVNENGIVKENEGDFRDLRELIKKGRTTAPSLAEATPQPTETAGDAATDIPGDDSVGTISERDATAGVPYDGAASATLDATTAAPDGEPMLVAAEGETPVEAPREELATSSAGGDATAGVPYDEAADATAGVPYDEAADATAGAPYDGSVSAVSERDAAAVFPIEEPTAVVEATAYEEAPVPTASLPHDTVAEATIADQATPGGIQVENIDLAVDQTTDAATPGPLLPPADSITLATVDHPEASATLDIQPLTPDPSDDIPTTGTESVENPVDIQPLSLDALPSSPEPHLPAPDPQPPTPPSTAADGNGFGQAIARLGEIEAYIESACVDIERHGSKAEAIMASLMALKPLTINPALLSDRRYTQIFSTAQGLAEALKGIAASVGGLAINKAKLQDIAKDLDHAAENLLQSAKSSPVPSLSVLTTEQLAEIRSTFEEEVKEALLQEMSADRAMVEQQEAEMRERYEEELRARLEAKIRAELAAQLASAASTPAASGRTIEVTAAPEPEEDMVEDLPEELVEAFTAEAEEHLQNIGRDLAALEKSPGNADILRSIRRSVHTLKGAAATMGFRVTGELAHALEDLLDKVNEGRLQVDPTIESLILDTTSTFETLVASAVAGQKEDRDLLNALKPRFEGILATVPLEEEDISSQLPEAAPVAPQEQPAGVKRASLQIHIGIDRLDDVINLVGEQVINRATFEQRMSGVKQALGELDLSTNRLKRLSQDLSARYEVAALLHGGSRRNGGAWAGDKPSRYLARGNGGKLVATGKDSALEAEFDELELDRYTEFHRLTRELAESASDIGTVSGEMETLLAQFDTVLTRQSRINSELQDKLMRLRLVPLANLTPRLYRTVRNVALSQGKEVELVLEGEDVEVDKTVFEGISDPLIHIMRNAVDHGLESPEERRAAGKAEKGRVTLQAYYEGSQVIIKVGDDGRGIFPAEVRDAAVARGIIKEGDRPTNAELLDLLFQPGFSTSAEVSETSGRGVGLDIVRTNVTQLRGTVHVTSSPGGGTTFTIRLPLTLSVTRAQLIKAGNEVFAIPLSHISQIVRLSDQHLSSIGPDDVLSLQDQIYPVFKLGEALGLPEPLERAKSWTPVVITGVRGREVAMVVDEVLGQQEIVIKNLGGHFKSLRGISGATILGNGEVILILNVPDLVEEEESPQPILPAAVSRPTSTGPLNVLVVDDSPSVRRVVSNTLQKAGLNPSVAKDGVDALEVVQFRRPDVILLDIEMPRMDGYELLSVLKGQDAYKGIPVVMLTSRSGDKHRQKAMQLGANGYLVKPYRDDELLSMLRNLAGSKASLVQ